MSFFVIKTILELISDQSKYNDIITPNVENFLEIAKHIYPTEILLEQTHNDSLHDTFLIYSCVFGKRNYRVLVRVSVCVCVCVCVCLCVCVCVCTITQKEIDLGTRNRSTL